MDKKNKRNIYFLLFAGVVILSTSGILIRLATAAPLIITYRMFFSILFMSPFIFQKYREALVYFKEIKLLLVGFFLAAHFFLWTATLNIPVYPMRLFLLPYSPFLPICWNIFLPEGPCSPESCQV